MDHCFDWSFKEIPGELLHRIEFIGVRDSLVGADPLKCFGDFATLQRIPELQACRVVTNWEWRLRCAGHPPSRFRVGRRRCAECIFLPLLLLDCFLQVIDGFRQRDFNQKAACFVEAESPTVERDRHWTARVWRVCLYLVICQAGARASRLAGFHCQAQHL